MPTYEQPKKLTFAFEPQTGGYISSQNFFKFIQGDWNPKLSKKDKLNPKNIEKVVFNPPATIVIFKDGTKEIAKAHNEDFDPEKGFAIAMLNIMFDGNKSELKRFIKKYVDESNKTK